MESLNIKETIEKYFNGETTVAEEKMLRTYFNESNVAPELEKFSPMFQYFTEAKQERYTKTIPLKPRRNYYRWASVAAVVVVAFGVYFGNQYQEQQEAKYAYEQTKKAFDLLAQNFDRGTSKVGYLNQFEATKQKIYKKN